MRGSGAHVATHNFIVARTSGKDGDAFGLTAFIVPMKAQGVNVAELCVTSFRVCVLSADLGSACGLSTCRPIMRASSFAMCGCRTRPSSGLKVKE